MNERERQERVCVSKTSYRRLRDAEREIERQKKRRRRFVYYACSICDGWHLTKED